MPIRRKHIFYFGIAATVRMYNLSERRGVLNLEMLGNRLRWKGDPLLGLIDQRED